ncbi:MAG TPA: UDP-glucose 4-epimerase GalE, partial [Pyrinomonadaceae bacterium]|nr:UDP-glucose 4-epimerase GalE [Pyrinomonadaceae bacterium]
MRILVTGGAGYIGSVIVEELLRAGHELTVYDNLNEGHRAAVSPGAEFVHADLLDRERLKSTLRQRNIEVVIHTASDSLAGESMQHPAKCYETNFLAGLSLLGVMKDAQITRLIFSSTAAVYGELYWQRIEEADPPGPTNPYSETKLAFERALHWYEQAYGLRYVTFRYFNVAGATVRCGEWRAAETHLIPLLLQVAAGRRSHLEIYGDDYPTRDGTCVRDYIHVVDLARAHRLAINILNERSAVYNVGCGGDGFTVKEVISCASKITGKEIPARITARRAEDPAIVVASSKLIKQELGWS